MARSTKKASGGRAQTRSRSRKTAAPAVEVEVVEEEKGMGIDDGIVLITAVVLLTAFLMVDYSLGNLFGEGMFFKP